MSLFHWIKGAKDYMNVGKSRNVRILLLGSKQSGKKSLLKALNTTSEQDGFCECALSTSITCQIWRPEALESWKQTPVFDAIIAIFDASTPNEWTSVLRDLPAMSIPIFLVMNKTDLCKSTAAPTYSYVKAHLQLYERPIGVLLCSLKKDGIDSFRKQLDTFLTKTVS